MITAEFYSNCSSKKRPEKNCSAGFGDYCCIPECKSAFYTKRDGKRVKTGFSLFKFPKDNTEKRRWINMISMYQRKGAGDNFSPYDKSKKYFACEHHFKADQIRVSLGIGRKTLRPGAIASIFNFKNPSKIKPRKLPKNIAHVCQLQMNPLATILILKRNLKLITQMTYYQSCTLKQILVVRNCWKRRLTT